MLLFFQLPEDGNDAVGFGKYSSDEGFERCKCSGCRRRIAWRRRNWLRIGMATSTTASTSAYHQSTEYESRKCDF